MNARFFIFSLLSISILAACGHYQMKPNFEDAKYWQRTNASSALYLQGPKAQQMLHMNISECVTTLKELKSLGEVRKAIPSTYADDSQLSHWDTPERDGYLRAEHTDFHDFETCMKSKGWERVEYLPYDEAAKAKSDYSKRASNKLNTSGNNREVVTTVHQPLTGTSAPTFNE